MTEGVGKGRGREEEEGVAVRLVCRSLWAFFFCPHRIHSSRLGHKTGVAQTSLADCTQAR